MNDSGECRGNLYRVSCTFSIVTISGMRVREAPPLDGPSVPKDMDHPFSVIGDTQNFIIYEIQWHGICLSPARHGTLRRIVV
jgi:hypothetical protein